jgi:hypothetical protein
VLTYKRVIQNSARSRGMSRAKSLRSCPQLRICEPSHTRLAITIHNSQKPISSKSYFFLHQSRLAIFLLFLPCQLKAQHSIVIMPALSPFHTKASLPSAATRLLYRLRSLLILQYQICNCRHSAIADRRRGGLAQGSPPSGICIADHAATDRWRRTADYVFEAF